MGYPEDSARKSAWQFIHKNERPALSMLRSNRRFVKGDFELKLESLGIVAQSDRAPARTSHCLREYGSSGHKPGVEGSSAPIPFSGPPTSGPFVAHRQELPCQRAARMTA